jgi:drug/metabolite transporter (DMT)-like permease
MSLASARDSAASSALARRRTLNGILCMLAAGGCFATMDTLVKWLSPRFSVMQIIFFRSLFAFVPIALQIAREGGLTALRTTRLRDHVGRSLFGFFSLVGFIYAFGRMPLADVVAIGFSAPIFITALSVPLLGETVGIRRWSAVLVGFIGVLVMVRPGSGVFGQVALVALGGTLLYSLAMVFVRRLGRTESTGAITFYYTLVCTAAGAASLPFVWVTPDVADAAWLVTIGLIGGCGQILVTAAFRNGPAAVVAPFDYASILYVSLLGYAIWGDVPDRILVLGAAIVVASGLYILHRESRRTTPQAVTQNPA